MWTVPAAVDLELSASGGLASQLVTVSLTFPLVTTNLFQAKQGIFLHFSKWLFLIVVPIVLELVLKV